MKIQIPKDNKHYDILMPILTANDYDDEKYNYTAITVAVGKSCKDMFEFNKEKDRLITDLFNRMRAGKVKLAFIHDFDPEHLSIDKFKRITYDDGINQYHDLAYVCMYPVTFAYSQDEKHITINYDNGCSYIAANFDNKWYIIMIDDATDSYIICGTLDMDTATIEDLISFIEFETGWPHYRDLMND